MRKSILVTSILGAMMSLNIMGTVHARAITSIKIEDVGSTVLASGADGETCNGGPGQPDGMGVRTGDYDTSGCEYDSTLDGKSGGFSFNKINPVTMPGGVTLWTGDAGTGTIDFSMANPVDSFTTGFIFLAPFVPFLGGPSVGNVAGDLTMTLDTFPFSGQFNGLVDFYLPPDAGTLMVSWLVPTADPNQYHTQFAWEHLITEEEDPSYVYVGFIARWVIEGTITVAAVVNDPTSLDGAVVPAVGLNVLTDESALISAGTVQDTAMESVCDPDCLDFKAPANAVSGVMTVVIPLSAAIPADKDYRVYINGVWANFDTLGGDALASAPGVLGECPLPGDVAYTSPVTAGDFCLQLSIADGGLNDGDLLAGVVTHLGGFGKALPEVVTPPIEEPAVTKPSSDSGSTNLWFALSLLSVLSLLRRQPR